MVLPSLSIGKASVVLLSPIPFIIVNSGIEASTEIDFDYGVT
jgi:hypothetical protein